MIDELIEQLESLNNNPKLWREIAKTYKNCYDSLVLVGFTSEQAMEIISRQGSGVKPSV